MSRETAVTEEISYSTTSCEVCGQEVAMDDVPEDVVDPQGYAVLLGEGTVTREFEDAGNWDQEIQFELKEKESHLPNVSAYLICEECAEAIHGISLDSPPYTGKLPSELTKTLEQNPGDIEIPNWLVYLLVIMFLLILISILL